MQKENKSLINTKKFNIKTKYLHIGIIIIGAIFSILASFHANLWFDESYSIAIANHPFNEIWTIGSYDVHPVLYYFMIKIIMLITNKSVICVRLFSSLPLIIMAVLGYTHVKKDFGEKAGMLFSFFSLFLPACLIYSSEIRMYTWAMLFVTIMTIYAFRIFRGKGNLSKTWIVFSIFSLASAYTHYYALAIAFLINISIFIYYLRKTYKNRSKKGSIYFENLKRSIISAIAQLLIYFPWLLIVIRQFKGTGGFWIGAPDFITIWNFQFTGNLRDAIHIPEVLSWIYTIAFTAYIIYMFIKYWKDKDVKEAKMLLALYFAIIIEIGIVSIIKTPILFARYFLNMTGIFILMIAILMSKDNIKKVALICLFTVIVSIVGNINLIKDNYNESNNKPLEFISEELQEEDIFVTDNCGSGFVTVAKMGIPYEKVYFWDRQNWNVDEAYKAFGKTIKDISELKDFKGRIWVIGTGDDFNLAKAVEEGLSEIETIKSDYFKIAYKTYDFAITLFEKE